MSPYQLDAPNNLQNFGAEGRGQTRAYTCAQCPKYTTQRGPSKPILVRRQIKSHYPCYARQTPDAPNNLHDSVGAGRKQNARKNPAAYGVLRYGAEWPERTYTCSLSLSVPEHHVPNNLQNSGSSGANIRLQCLL